MPDVEQYYDTCYPYQYLQSLIHYGLLFFGSIRLPNIRLASVYEFGLHPPRLITRSSIISRER